MFRLRSVYHFYAASQGHAKVCIYPCTYAHKYVHFRVCPNTIFQDTFQATEHILILSLITARVKLCMCVTYQVCMYVCVNERVCACTFNRGVSVYFLWTYFIVMPHGHASCSHTKSSLCICLHFICMCVHTHILVEIPYLCQKDCWTCTHARIHPDLLQQQQISKRNHLREAHMYEGTYSRLVSLCILSLPLSLSLSLSLSRTNLHIHNTHTHTDSKPRAVNIRE